MRCLFASGFFFYMNRIGTGTVRDTGAEVEAGDGTTGVGRDGNGTDVREWRGSGGMSAHCVRGVPVASGSLLDGTQGDGEKKFRVGCAGQNMLASINFKIYGN